MEWLSVTPDVFVSYTEDSNFKAQKKAFDEVSNTILPRPWYSHSVLCQCQTEQIGDYFPMPTLTKDMEVFFDFCDPKTPSTALILPTMHAEIHVNPGWSPYSGSTLSTPSISTPTQSSFLASLEKRLAPASNIWSRPQMGATNSFSCRRKSEGKHVPRGFTKL